jgi:hypothetical protein
MSHNAQPELFKEANKATYFKAAINLVDLT